MSTAPIQPDPDELRRNLAITLGQPPMQEHLGLPEGPQMAAPQNIQMPSRPTPNLAITPPASPMDALKARRDKMVNEGSGESQIYGKVTGSEFGQHHPLVGKILGGLGQVGATLGDIGLSAVAPGIAAAIPGTAYHHAQDVRGVNRQIGAEEGEQASEAQAASAQAEVPFRQAATEHERAATEALEHPPVKEKEESWKVIPEFTGPKGEPIEVEQNSGQVKIGGSEVAGIKPAKTTAAKEGNPQQQTYDDLIAQGYTPIQAYEKIREKPAGTGTGNEGTWSLQEDADGKPILLNSKTGEAKDAPSGIAKSGTHAKAEAATKKEMEPIEGAVGYASDYLKNGAFTGPGDEALQEKFFELAKPSTGFRMTQQQMAMLGNSRSWMGSLEGHLRHATTGTWFSDEQRKQIVDTMNQLANEKRKANAGPAQPATGAPSPNASPAATHRFNEATGEIEEIKK